MEVKGYGFRDSVLFLKKLNMPPQDPVAALTALAAGIGRPMPKGR
jgi:hypothetical protein